MQYDNHYIKNRVGGVNKKLSVDIEIGDTVHKFSTMRNNKIFMPFFNDYLYFYITPKFQMDWVKSKE